jgi:hypothetical protein
MSEMTFRDIGIWDLGIMTRVGVRKLGEIDGRIEGQSSDGLDLRQRDRRGPGTDGAGIQVYGYAIKNSGLIVEVNRQHLHVCMKEPHVKIRTSGVARAGLDGRGP